MSMGATIRIIVGALATLFGLVWALQGLNLLPGTFMRGSSLWVVIGLVVAAVGVTLLTSGIGRMRKPKA
jgi:hypothetical protein